MRKQAEDSFKKFQEEIEKISAQSPVFNNEFRNKTNGAIIDFKDPNKVRHHQLLNKFPEAKDALEMNELAIEYVKKDPNAIKEIIKYIKFQISQTKEDKDLPGEANSQ